MKKKPFFGVYNPSIILTYISVFCAIAGIMNLMKAPVETLNYMKTVLPLLIASGVCDMFDGAVARKCKRTDVEKEFGIQLDSLADTVAFVVFPACILLHLCHYDTISYVIACAYVFAGIMRLGWFNVTVEENKGYFQGMPVTLAAAIVPLAYLILHKLGLTPEELAIAAKILFSVIACLFIANFRFKKPGTKGRIILGSIALVVATIIIILL